MNPLLLSSRIVTRGYSLTRTHSERNDKAFLSWNMARTSTTRHANADADAEGFTASENERIEMMRKDKKSPNDIYNMVDEMRKKQKTEDDITAALMHRLQNMKDEDERRKSEKTQNDIWANWSHEMISMLETQHRIMMDRMKEMDKMEDARLSTLVDRLEFLGDKTRAEARSAREFDDDFS
jgi:glycerol-3-phosphate O-acyltransferase